MTETQCLLIFLCGMFGGVAVGALAGWWRGMILGFGVGCIVIGLGAAVAAGGIAWERWQFVAKGERVQGKLTHHSDGPVVAFTPSDGLTRSVKGLGGSQSSKGEGDAVPVHFLNGDPSTSLIADFQNTWGLPFVVSLFAALPLAFGTFFTVMAIGEMRPRRVRSGVAAPAPPLPRWRRLSAQTLSLAGNLAFVGSLWFFGSTDDTVLGVGRGFLSIASSVLLHALAITLRGKADFEIIGVCLIIALGFGLFGSGALLLGA